MDYIKNSAQNNATVLKPAKGGDASQRPEALPPDTPADAPVNRSHSEKNTLIKTGSGLDTGQVQALTQINISLKTTDNSVGFANARKQANQALASNKIILNNRFVLDSIIGSGGMGTVYKARDLRKVEANDTNPYVAVKVLNEAFQNHPDAFITLQREASKSSILAHPHIVTVHDFDRDREIIYMTMELLDGIDLETYIQQAHSQGVERETAFQIIRDYCSALVYAHKNNIIHSDFKPGNIFVTKNSTKVLDFGIARVSSHAQTTDHFDAGSLGALTPAYASLEMINREPPDQADDVYAAAVIAYELLSGKHPYQRKSAAEALEANLKPERLTKLSKKQWHALESGLQLKRSNRTRTVELFLQGLTRVRQYTRLKILSGMVLTGVLVAGYLQLTNTNDVATIIDKTLNNGLHCLNIKDYTCALESANSVLKLAPDNVAAKDLYTKSNILNIRYIENKYSTTASDCIDKNDVECARENLAALKLVAPQSSYIEIISNKIELKVIQNKTESCLTEKNYTCVIKYGNLMLKKEPQNVYATTLIKKISNIQALNNNKIESDLKNYQININKAQECYKSQDFNCSMKFSQQALLIKPGDRKAEALYQKSSYTQIQQQSALEKAKNILTQGEYCFKQKNYSCAIAKSESALEFIPNFEMAIKLKEDAKREVEKLKQSIVIE